MKVYLVITPFFPTLTSFRGPFVCDQVKAIAQTGKYRVVVFKPKPWYSKGKDYEYDGVKVFRFSTFELPSNILPGLFDKLSSWSMERKLKSIGVPVKDIDVVHAHVTGTGFLVNALKRKSPKIKTILQHHGFDVLSLTSGRFYQYKWHSRWVKKYGIRVCNFIDLHVGVSAKTLEYLRNNSEIKINDSFVLYNGVDTSKFYPVKGLKDPDHFTIGCIGNFWEIKDQITLIKAVEKLIQEGINNLRVIFIGSGALLQRCKDYVAEYDLDRYFEFRAEVLHRDLCRFYNTLDLFVLPSYYEALGCVYTEAYACGIPFIGIEGQGIEELVLKENRQYQLIKSSDARELTEKIKYFINHRNFKPQLNRDIGINILIKDFINFLET